MTKNKPQFFPNMKEKYHFLSHLKRKSLVKSSHVFFWAVLLATLIPSPLSAAPKFSTFCGDVFVRIKSFLSRNKKEKEPDATVNRVYGYDYNQPNTHVKNVKDWVAKLDKATADFVSTDLRYADPRFHEEKINDALYGFLKSQLTRKTVENLQKNINGDPFAITFESKDPLTFMIDRAPNGPYAEALKYMRAQLREQDLPCEWTAGDETSRTKGQWAIRIPPLTVFSHAEAEPVLLYRIAYHLNRIKGMKKQDLIKERITAMPRQTFIDEMINARKEADLWAYEGELAMRDRLLLRGLSAPLAGLSLTAQALYELGDKYPDRLKVLEHTSNSHYNYLRDSYGKQWDKANPSKVPKPPATRP